MWLGLLAVFSAAQAVHGLLNSTSVIVPENGHTVYPCFQVNHREPELESSMFGLWYAIELIQHRDDPRYRGTQVSDICPKLSIYMSSTPSQIKILWNEKAGDIHYNFKMVDPENKGFWIAWGKQNGTMLNKEYNQFAGSVQVIEAQPSRMVLMFCVNNRTHYSVVMVRNITIPHDTTDVHRTLNNYQLPEYGVRQTCRDQSDPNSASQSLPKLAVTLLIVIMVLFRLN